MMKRVLIVLTVLALMLTAISVLLAGCDNGQGGSMEALPSQPAVTEGVATKPEADKVEDASSETVVIPETESPTENGDQPADPTENATEPTTAPATKPTAEPTVKPTTEPTEEPTEEPTAEPTTEPSTEPTVAPGAT